LRAFANICYKWSNFGLWAWEQISDKPEKANIPAYLSGATAKKEKVK
jgi:hypothetical protein